VETNTNHLIIVVFLNSTDLKTYYH
jgi:hypothetical protein